MNKDEALDLALNALLWANTEINDWRDDARGYKPEDQPQIMKAITAIKQALAAQQEHEPENEPHVSLASVQEPPPECQTEAEKRAYAFGWWKALEAQRALDKKAENARELGLDYEPVREDWGPGPHEYHSLPPAAPVQDNDAYYKGVVEGVQKLFDDKRAQPAHTQDIPDLIAGALGVSRGTAYDMMREALREASPVQEPVAKYIGECSEGSLVQLYEDVKKGTNFYTTPPAAQRQWVELTFAEICECENDYLHLFARAIEAKLKEKNNG
jgi:hypothetical protein